MSQESGNKTFWFLSSPKR